MFPPYDRFDCLTGLLLPDICLLYLYFHCIAMVFDDILDKPQACFRASNRAVISDYPSLMYIIKANICDSYQKINAIKETIFDSD